MNKTDFQNGFALGMISGGVVEVEVSKPEQEKTVNITENGTTEVVPDEDKVLSKVTVIADIQSGGGGTEELEQLIDNSGVLDSTEGTATEKVEQLIDLAEWEKAWYKQTENMTTAQRFFYNFEGYPTIPRTNFINCTNFASMCENAKIEYIDYIIAPQIQWRVQADRMFFNSSVKHIAGVKPRDVWWQVTSMFQSSSIEVIDEPFDFTGISNPVSLSATFACYYLREVRFVANGIPASMRFSSANLSAESIESIAYGLAYVTTAQTLTLNKVFENDFEKLPAELRDLITNQKGWTLAFAN